MRPIRNVLVPVDWSEPSLEALRTAAALAQEHDASAPPTKHGAEIGGSRHQRGERRRIRGRTLYPSPLSFQLAIGAPA
jgi:hypothetical protein